MNIASVKLSNKTLKVFSLDNGKDMAVISADTIKFIYIVPPMTDEKLQSIPLNGTDELNDIICHFNTKYGAKYAYTGEITLQLKKNGDSGSHLGIKPTVIIE